MYDIECSGFIVAKKETLLTQISLLSSVQPSRSGGWTVKIV